MQAEGRNPGWEVEPGLRDASSAASELRWLCLSNAFKFKWEAAGDDVEIFILGQQCIAMLQAQLGNQAIDGRTDSETLGLADPIDMGGFLVILTTVLGGVLEMPPAAG